jgi:hypothetical protein
MRLSDFIHLLPLASYLKTNNLEETQLYQTVFHNLTAHTLSY